MTAVTLQLLQQLQFGRTQNPKNLQIVLSKKS
jgi:hypothetical protein